MEFDDDFNFPVFPDLPWLSLEDDFHGTIPVATGHEPTESEPVEHEPAESEPVEHEPGDFEITIDSSNLMFHMPEAPQVEVKEKDRGGDAIAQTFYEGPPRCRCCTNWVERPPAQIPEATQDRYDRVAIRIYKKKGGTKRYGNILGQKIKEIEIQSPVIIKAIQPLLAEVGMPVYSARQGLVMSSPFKELYFAHSKILNLVQPHEPGSLERTHLDLLAQTLNELFADVSREVTDLNAQKRTSYSYLWTLFPKDIIVYSRVHGPDQLYQVITTEVYKTFFMVRCRHVCFNGVRFGTACTPIHIHVFDGCKLVSELPVYPLGFHPDPELEERLADRGSRVLDFQGTSYRNYNGSAKAAKFDDEEEYDKDDMLKSYHVTGRVIIDPFAFEKFEPGCVTELEKVEGVQERSEAETSKQNSMSAIFCELAKESRKGLRPSIEAQQLNTTRLRKHRECLCLMSPMLPGFSLKIKKWLSFCVDNIATVSWNEEAYDHLVLPEKTKGLLRTFVGNHGQSRANYPDDVVGGKGQGLIILLDGPPGTGKTLAAEAVADKTRLPLMYLHAEDLGTKSFQVGLRLSRALDLATEWNAIVLLDEADTFLAQRSLDSASRNEIVAAMFRHLEYYQGIIFLTTNLLGSIDEAFLSRTNLHIRFPALSAASRRAIWNNFLGRLRLFDPSSMTQDDDPGTRTYALDLAPKDLDSLAEWNLNGREIKNIVKNAHLLCHYDHLNMSLDRLTEAILVTTPFARKASPDPGA